MLRRVLLYSFLILALASTISAQPDIATLGPQVGSRVPDFVGQDQFDRRQSLASVLGPQGAMIVFFRSADW
jgi:hypothetical protein